MNNLRYSKVLFYCIFRALCSAATMVILPPYFRGCSQPYRFQSQTLDLRSQDLNIPFFTKIALTTLKQNILNISVGIAREASRATSLRQGIAPVDSLINEQHSPGVMNGWIP